MTAVNYMGADLCSQLEGCYGSVGFATAPFRITPDTDFIVPHTQYLEALGHLRFGLATGNFTLITGDVGLGKTLLCRYMLNQLPADVSTAYIFNPLQKYEELLGSILYDLTGEVTGLHVSTALLHDRLFSVLAKLAASGKRVAILIDEAHCLAPDVLEGLRLLSNLETSQRKLLSLLLVGQNELEQTLQTPGMRALRQRISVWYRLRPFTARESEEYVHHRLGIACNGGSDGQTFEITTPACRVAHYYARGVPRRLNQICDRALLASISLGHMRVGARLMWRAAREVTALEAP